MSISSVNSNKTSPANITGTYLYLTDDEKWYYDRVKKGIQKNFTQEKPTGGALFEINATRDYTYASRGVVETRLSDQVLEHLVNRIKARGFEASVQKDWGEGGAATCPGASIFVAILDEVKDESGYVSEGWDASFRNSIVKPRATTVSKRPRNSSEPAKPKSILYKV